MVVLGLNLFHSDSSACLVVDGIVIAAVAQERVGGREKHDSSLPIDAIKFVLEQGRVELKHVDVIAVPKNPKANSVAKMKYALGSMKSGSFKAWLESKRRARNTETLSAVVAEKLQVNLNKNIPLFYVEHHLAHIASAYFCAPDIERATGVSYDASGDFVSCMVADCQGSNIEIKRKIYLPDSLGFFYTAVCQFIGFDRFGEEYKVMGLAPYGDDRYGAEMRTLLRILDDGAYLLNKRFFKMHSGGISGDGSLDSLYSDSFFELFGCGPFKRSVEITDKQKQIAKSAQVMFEKAVVALVKSSINQVGCRDLVTAGGCALNGVANAKIAQELEPKSHFIQPAASDDGTAMGAALFAFHSLTGKERRYHMTGIDLGPKSSEFEIEKALCDAGLRFEKFEEKDLLENTAGMILSGNVVGWYQGGSEWGPRALGHRSILADATNPDVKDLINQKIKRRETFRPFAPSVLSELVSEYFESVQSSDYMMHVDRFKPKYREIFKGVCHVDGTGRLQSVKKSNNVLYWKLLQEIKRKSGFGIVLNTSFNENEPIVSYIEEAISCFVRTDMDALIAGPFIVRKRSD